MSTRNVNKLQEVLEWLTTEVVGDYFVADDGQFRWVGEVEDVTDEVVEKVTAAEKEWLAYRKRLNAFMEDGPYLEEHEPPSGNDELCHFVGAVKDEDVLRKVQALFEEQGGDGPVSTVLGGDW